jgi:hypothetical protein
MMRFSFANKTVMTKHGTRWFSYYVVNYLPVIKGNKIKYSGFNSKKKIQLKEVAAEST